MMGDDGTVEASKAATETRIKVGEPQTSGRIKKVTTYAVTTPAQSATDRPVVVRHRYSEFDFLRSWLCKTYPGMLVPPMPEKVMSPSQEDIQERVRSLEEFINDVYVNPYLKEDAILNGFLTTEDSTWTGLMNEATKFPEARVASEESNSESVGRKRWIAMLDRQVLPENPESSVTVLNNQLYRIAGLADGCVDTATRMWQNAQHYAASIQMWQERIRGESAGLETTANIEDSQAAVSKLLNDQSHMLKIVADRGTMWRDTSLFQPQECKQLLLANSRDKMRLIGAMKNLLSRRASALKDYRSAWHQKEKCGAQVQKFKDSGKGDKVAKKLAQAETLLVKLEENLEAERLRLERITKAVLLSEVARALHQMLLQYKRVIGQFAVLQAASAVKMQKIWKGLLDDLVLDTDDMATLAKKTVGGQPMDTLPYCQFFPDVSADDVSAAPGSAAAAAFGGDDLDDEPADAAAAAPEAPVLDDDDVDGLSTEVDL
jgi:hypothetical protein